MHLEFSLQESGTFKRKHEGWVRGLHFRSFSFYCPVEFFITYIKRTRIKKEQASYSMASFETTPEYLRVILTLREKALTFHNDFTIPWSNVISFEHVDNVRRCLHGVHVRGFSVPALVTVGVKRYREGRDFCAVYGYKPGALILLKDDIFRRVLITTDVLLEKPKRKKIWLEDHPDKPQEP